MDKRVWVTGGKLAWIRMSVSEERKESCSGGTKQALCIAKDKHRIGSIIVLALSQGEQGQQCEIAASRKLSGPTMALGRLVHWLILPVGPSLHQLRDKARMSLARGQRPSAEDRPTPGDGGTERWRALVILQSFTKAREINGTWLEPHGVSAGMGRRGAKGADID